MAFSSFFVFMCLIEYAIAIIYANFQEDKKASAHNAAARPSIPDVADSKTFRITGKVPISHGIKVALSKIYGKVDWTKAPLNRNKVDYTSRILFPFLYLTFILVYVFVFVVPWAVKA